MHAISSGSRPPARTVARAALALATAASLLVLAACASSAEPEAGGTDSAEPIRATYLSSSAGLPALVAQQQGFFEDEGLEIEFTAVPNPVTGLQVLGTDFDIVAVTATDVALAAANGRDIQTFSAAYRDSSETQQFDLLAAGGVTDVEGLRGKIIGVPALSGVVYFSVVNMLAAEGVGVDEVNIVQVAFSDVGAQLEAKVIDAAVSTQPFTAPLLEDESISSLGDPLLTIADPVLFGLWAATGAWLSENAEAAASYRSAIEKANAWIEENDAQAREILMKDLGQPEQAAASVVLPQWTTELSAEDLQPWLDVLADQDAAPEGTIPTADSLVFAP